MMVRGVGDITADNKRTITAQWILGGLSLTDRHRRSR